MSSQVVTETAAMQPLGLLDRMARGVLTRRLSLCNADVLAAKAAVQRYVELGTGSASHLWSGQKR